MTLEPISLKDIPRGDVFLQSALWGDFKSRYGWEALAFLGSYQGQAFPILILLRNIKPFGSLAYVPHGPSVNPSIQKEPVTFFTELKGELKKHLPKNTFAIRFDLPWRKSEELKLKAVLNKAPVDIQPPHTVLLNLEPSLEDLLGAAKKKTRYNIRLSQKKCVEIKRGGLDSLKEWYRMYQETALRDKIAIHSWDYYKDLFIALSADDTIQKELLMAYHEGDLLAGILVLGCGDKATYLYGASSNIKRNLMPAYGLQWEAIRLAKEEWQCREYDFFGIPPEEDPNHPMSGLYRFKTGFGGEIVSAEGAWDQPFNLLIYSLYRTGEVLRDLYFKKIRKR